jgi:hypothetical protein
MVATSSRLGDADSLGKLGRQDGPGQAEFLTPQQQPPRRPVGEGPPSLVRRLGSRAGLASGVPGPVKFPKGGAHSVAVASSRRGPAVTLVLAPVARRGANRAHQSKRAVCSPSPIPSLRGPSDPRLGPHQLA